MQITAKVSNDNKDVFRSLIEKGCSIRPAGDHTIITLVHGGWIPRELKGDFEIYVEGAETGGKSVYSGDSIICCGTNGKPLRPFFIPVNPKPCMVHARFAIPNSMVLVRGFSHCEDILIAEYNALIYNQKAYLRTKLLYMGSIDQLPMDYLCFDEPAQAAVDKANCDMCNHIHFAQERE